MYCCSRHSGDVHLIQRKKRTHDSDGEGKSSKQMEEKLKKVRKRNADLVALAKQLDDKYKSLRIENEQLVSCMLCEMFSVRLRHCQLLAEDCTALM